MSVVKAKIEQEKVVLYLKNNFDDSIDHVELVVGGESSQVFSFQASSGDFIIRVNMWSTSGFEKDSYAFNYFKTENILIPEIIEIGKIDEKYNFAISKKAKGATINNLCDEEYHKTFPNLLNILDAIHCTDINNSSGYGRWSNDGIAPYNSWKEFIFSVQRWVQNKDVFTNSFLEKDVWEIIFKKMAKLAELCPEERYLVHGDYGNNNVTAEDGKVTGVFDWADSLYGDFVYDIAWMTFWLKSKEKQQSLEKYYEERNIKNFAERLFCYKLRIALGSMSFYSFSKQKEKYDLVKELILRLLGSI